MLPPLAARDEMLTIAPPAFRSRKYLAAAWVTRKVPFRCTSMTISQSSTESLWSIPSRVIPALFTTMSNLPNRSTVAFTADSTSAGCVTSHVTANAAVPSSHLSAASQKSLRDRPSDAHRGSGDQCDAALQRSHRRRAQPLTQLPDHATSAVRCCGSVSNASTPPLKSDPHSGGANRRRATNCCQARLTIDLSRELNPNRCGI